MFNWLKRQIRDYFGFSKTETNGVWVLMMIIMLCLASPLLMRWYDTYQPSADHNADVVLLDSLVQELEAQVSTAKSSSQAKLSSQASKHTDRTFKPRIKQKNTHKIQLFDINTAATNQLQQIQGIGPQLAKRTIQYRDRLGGFVNQEQYQEIYGLNATVLERLVAYSYIAVDFQPRQLDINTADFKTLLAHPYLTYEQVKKIMQYRDKHGRLDKLADLVDLGILDQASFERTKRYLKL